MNSIFNDFVLATPLEQFQILPFTAQMYTGLGPNSVDLANLFPEMTGEDEWVYLAGGADHFDRLTSWNHQAWVDLNSTTPAYLYAPEVLAGTIPNQYQWLEAGFDLGRAGWGAAQGTLNWFNFGTWLVFPLAAMGLLIGKGILAGYLFISGPLGYVCGMISALIGMAFAFIGMAIATIFPWQGQGGIFIPGAEAISTNNMSSWATGLDGVLLMIKSWVEALLQGNLVFGNSFTNFLMITILTFVMLKLVLSFAIYKTKLIPTRWQSVYEIFYSFILSTICEIVGAKKGEKYFPAFFALFLIIFGANVIALFPYTYSITAQIIVTFTISFIAFFGVNLIGFLNHGVYLLGMFLPKGCPFAIVPGVIMLELIAYSFRLISLALRIFANILSGHCMLKILTIFVWFVFSLGGFMLIVHSLSLGIVMVINILEIMVAFVQAGVFVILMSVYTNDVLEAGH